MWLATGSPEPMGFVLGGSVWVGATLRFQILTYAGSSLDTKPAAFLSCSDEIEPENTLVHNNM